MTNEELIKALRAWDGSPFDDDAHEAADRIEELQSKLDKAVAAMQALKDFDELPLSAKRPDVFERRVRHPILVALAEIKGE
jgi:nitrate reductase assembly molybdenum cofactor insertion protein NarJ